MPRTMELLDNLMAIREAIEVAEKDKVKGYVTTLIKQEKQIEDLLKTKTDNIDAYIMSIEEKKNILNAKIKTFKEETDRLKRRLRAVNNTEQYLKEFTIPNIIAVMGKDNTLETSTARYTRFNKYRVLIRDEQKVDEKYIITKTIRKIDKRTLNKDAIRQYKKDNKSAEGCEIIKKWAIRRS